MSLTPEAWDAGWTLFLDRDGVLNRLIPGDYVRHPEELDVLPGVPEAVRDLRAVFGRVFVTTNQRGIALGLMSAADLAAVHSKLTASLQAAGTYLDGIYHCPHDKGQCTCRKPGTGMPLQAQSEFPEVDFRRAVMVGDSESDLQMARALGMQTVWVGERGPADAALADLLVHSLPDLVRWMQGGAAAQPPAFAAPDLSADYWDSRYACGDHPWDLGEASPPLRDFIASLQDTSARILIPGAGTAWEAGELHRRGFTQVYVLDWAPEAIRRFRESHPGFPQDHAICADFFRHAAQYDLVLEQTFFCALPPAMRQDYVRQMARVIRPGGLLAGVMFDFPLTVQGPPFGGSAPEYHQLFSPFFEILRMEPCVNSARGREQRELFVEFRRKA